MLKSYIGIQGLTVTGIHLNDVILVNQKDAFISGEYERDGNQSAVRGFMWIFQLGDFICWNGCEAIELPTAVGGGRDN